MIGLASATANSAASRRLAASRLLLCVRNNRRFCAMVLFAAALILGAALWRWTGDSEMVLSAEGTDSSKHFSDHGRSAVQRNASSSLRIADRFSSSNSWKFHDPQASDKYYDGRLERSAAGVNVSVADDQQYGRWPLSLCDPCRVNCMERMARVSEVPLSLDGWGWRVLTQQLNVVFDEWKRRGGFTIDQHVTMNSCAFKTRTRWNPHGVWLHISGRNVTTLRMMADGYRRAEHIKQYLKHVVAESPLPFTTPLVVYVSVTDVPCNILAPYLTFFGRRDVSGIVIPDDSFFRSVHGGSWEQTRAKYLVWGGGVQDEIPYRRRQHKLFFRGSPTHISRENIRKTLMEQHPEFADIKLAVVEKFRHTTVKMEDHAQYQFLLAIRGKTASSRDKYLNLLGSTIVWAAESEEPWFQFYHALWRPYLNYVPLAENDALCVSRMLSNFSNAAIAERIAAHGAAVGRFLSQRVADDYTREVLRRYAALQTYRVPEDPLEFMHLFRGLVRKRYRSALVMPDDQTPIKFFFEKWLSRRIKQMSSCRTNNTYNGVPLPPDSKYRCWYM